MESYAAVACAYPTSMPWAECATRLIFMQSYSWFEFKVSFSYVDSFIKTKEPSLSKNLSIAGERRDWFMSNKTV